MSATEIKKEDTVQWEEEPTRNSLHLQKSFELLRSAGMDVNTTAKLYKRETKHRVFVNRSLHLQKIRFYGFDMDYTLAQYKSPQYESLAFSLLLKRLISIGYPEAIASFEYDPTFPIRGLWFDCLYGNLLKVDPYGNVLSCVHGFQFLHSQDIRKLYPNKFIQLDESRIYVLNTLFNLPECYLLACLIDYFSSSEDYVREPTGVKCGDLFMSFKSIFQNLRQAVDWVHLQGSLKELTVQKIEEYVHKDERLPVLLDRLREHGAKTFLLTNSDYGYSEKVMAYLLNTYADNEPDRLVRDWTTYFDYIVVDANKPLFFSEGTILRQVDKKTGICRIGLHTGPLKAGHIYSGGSCEIFSKLIGARGKDVLYVGDHIFGDILKSKKIQGWRTFLIVPEIAHELQVWTTKHDLYTRLQNLDALLSQMYRNLDSTAQEKPDITNIQAAMTEVSHEMDMSYGLLGSVFRSGSRQTFFADQVMRYADVYASTHLNLTYYPFSYLFKAPSTLMPHELTVEPSAAGEEAESTPIKFRSRANTEDDITHPTPGQLPRQLSAIPHMFAEAPLKITHHHDEDDDSDNDSSGTNGSDQASN